MPQSNKLSFGKILPANLTANADYIVAGNPVTSRPESGVDNSYPGLEFDQRNLDKAFFPGLRFEFYRSDGANLVGMEAGSQPLSDQLLRSTEPLYLWALVGSVRVGDDQPDEYSFRGQDGLSAWRRVHDLLPGRIAIVIGPSRGFHTDDPNISFGAVRDDVRAVYDVEDVEGDASSITRTADDGSLQYLVLSGERADYLDEQGVIDPDAYEPGDLTKTLCAPWMYDFRDCGCFYWASNKPDVVQSEDGSVRYMNFLRRDRDKLPAEESERVTNLDEFNTRRAGELTYADLVNGAWETTLPVVLNDREGTAFEPSPGPSGMPMLTEAEAIAELEYLASVEHALIAEYLFARYSLKQNLPDPSIQQQITAATEDLFSIALEEMRHLRWANQALGILGALPTLERAQTIGKSPEPDSERKSFDNKQYMETPFALVPLTLDQLQWFIDVERPSQTLGEGLDGMYVELLRTFSEDTSGTYPEAERLVELMKLIVDEGEGHFHRFLSMQRTLSEVGEHAYLHDFTGTPDAEQIEILELADLYYDAILRAVQISFSLADAATGRFIRAAIRSMESLDEIGFALAKDNIGLRFTLPTDLPRIRLNKSESHSTITGMESKLKHKLESMMQSDSTTFASMVERHTRSNSELFHRLHQIIEQEYDE